LILLEHFFWEYFGYNVFHGIPRKLFANSKSLGSYFFHHVSSKTKKQKNHQPPQKSSIRVSVATAHKPVETSSATLPGKSATP